MKGNVCCFPRLLLLLLLLCTLSSSSSSFIQSVSFPIFSFGVSPTCPLLYNSLLLLALYFPPSSFFSSSPSSHFIHPSSQSVFLFFPLGFLPPAPFSTFPFFFFLFRYFDSSSPASYLLLSLVVILCNNTNQILYVRFYPM